MFSSLQKHILHPLNLFVAVVAVFSIIMWTVEIADNFFTMMFHLQGDYSTGDTWSWTHMIGAVIVVIGFSSGVIGALVNLSHAIRLRGSKVEDFSPIKSLSKDEIKALNMWIDSNTYDSIHLQELWGEDSNESH